jgi:hypothetical protein
VRSYRSTSTFAACKPAKEQFSFVVVEEAPDVGYFRASRASLQQPVVVPKDCGLPLQCPLCPADPRTGSLHQALTVAHDVSCAEPSWRRPPVQPYSSTRQRIVWRYVVSFDGLTDFGNGVCSYKGIQMIFVRRGDRGRSRGQRVGEGGLAHGDTTASSGIFKTTQII